MAPFLEKLLADPALDLKPDAGLLDRLKAKNQQELERLDNTLKDAKENLGEIEVSDALRARASYLSKIGDQVRVERASSGRALTLEGIRTLRWLLTRRR